MATKPKIVTLTNSSADVLNAIRNSATTNYRDYVPVATDEAEVIRTIGAVIMDNPALQNEFLNALINRIGKVIVTSRSYTNPLAAFKKGVLDFGETVEEIFVDLITPFQYDPAIAENELYKREKPDVRSAFHIVNYQKFYKVTVQEADLRKAFLSADGVTTFITNLVESMYKSAEYDEFLVMKYLLARMIIGGRVVALKVPAVSSATAHEIVSKIKGVSNAITFMNTEYNIAGVHNRSEKNKQYVLLNSEFDAVADVNVMAMAFNMDKAEFMGHRILVDSFGTLDTARLAVLFEGDNTYEEISSDDLASLDKIPAVLLDEDFFQIYDQLIQIRNAENGQGMYWNYLYHVWKIMSVSPFAPAACFIDGEPTVESVTVVPSALETTEKVGSTTLEANVTTTNFADKSVDWTIESAGGNTEAKVSKSGLVTWSKGATNDTIVVKATSKLDPEKSMTATITIK